MTDFSSATKPTVIEAYCDNGEFSHFLLINTDTGAVLWSADPIETIASGQKIEPSGQLNCMQMAIHKNAKDKGFYDEENPNFGEKIALIHSEVSEALEADRLPGVTGYSLQCISEILKFDKRTFVMAFEDLFKDKVDDELADIVIRVMDLAEFKEIDLEGHIIAKMRYNTYRERKHSKDY